MEMGIQVGFQLLSKTRTFIGISISKDGEIFHTDDNLIGIIDQVTIEFGFIFGAIAIKIDIGKRLLSEDLNNILKKIKSKLDK